MHAGPQARALKFGKFSGLDKAKEVTKIIGSILLCMRVTIPGTHGRYLLIFYAGKITRKKRLTIN